MDEQPSLGLLQALSFIWSKIRKRHPDVPEVVLLPAPAPRRQLNVLGHFAALRWTGRKEQGHHLHEVVVVAEHLDRPAEDTLETLLHEAGHALNFERGIKDCSASQYHNKKFREAAMELGLEVKQVRHYGFALTTLLPATAADYEEETKHLQEVLIHRRRPVLLTTGPGTTPSTPGLIGGGGSGPRTRSRKAVCACSPPFIIRVSRKTLSSTVIRCESCGEPFKLA